LAFDVGARKSTAFEAIFGGLFLSKSRNITRGQKLVDQSLILADAIGKHATMVTIVIDTPLNGDFRTSSVGDHRCLAPLVSGGVVVNANAGIVSARTAASHGCFSETWPCSNRLEDGTLWTGIYARLFGTISPE